MRISGKWAVFEDGSLRPLVRVKVVGAGGQRVSEDFLIDTGADRTVLSAAVIDKSNLPTSSLPSGTALSGVGGHTDSAVVSTVLEFVREDESAVRVRGEFAAFLDSAFGDLSILGRDVLDNFDVLVSRRRDEVVLLAGRHRYSIEVES